MVVVEVQARGTLDTLWTSSCSMWPINTRPCPYSPTIHQIGSITHKHEAYMRTRATNTTSNLNEEIRWEYNPQPLQPPMELLVRARRANRMPSFKIMASLLPALDRLVRSLLTSACAQRRVDRQWVNYWPIQTALRAQRAGIVGLRLHLLYRPTLV